jgi:hypothetical protein
LFLVVALRAGDFQRAAVRGSEIFPRRDYTPIFSTPIDHHFSS